MDSIIEFYNSKKILVTGHTGFKGSWLTLLLHKLGAEVFGIALPPKSSDDHYIVANIEKYCQSAFHNINDIDFLKQTIKTFQPDLVFHLAAQPLVRYSYRNPIETYQTNVMGTASVLEAIKEVNGKCGVVVITTDKVYENKEWIFPYREGDRLGGFDPYSSSKACAELVVQSYRNSFFNINEYTTHLKAIASARAGNVIGGGDWSEDRLIPDIIRALQENKEIIIRNPDAIRPWQHVIEPLVGYLRLGKMLYSEPIKFSGEWNFGPFPEDVLTVKEVVNVAIQTLGKGSFKIEKKAGDLHEASLLKLDISKATHLLKWEPLLSLGETIEWTLQWYKAYLSDKTKNMYAVSMKNINDYFTLLKK